MIRFECDKCGVALGANDANRFIVKMEAYAAAAPIEFSAQDLAKERSDELRALIEGLHHADPDAIEDQTYRSLRFDLCPRCHRDFLRKPLA